MASSSACAPREGAESLPDVAGKDGSGSPPEQGATTPPHDRRFPRPYRLTARRQFLAVYGERLRVSAPSFTLHARRLEGPSCRLGLTVPKRVGKAVRRNRIKRVVREVFRHHRVTLEPAYDLVVNARPGMDQRSHAEIEREFLDAFRKLRRRDRSRGARG